MGDNPPARLFTFTILETEDGVRWTKAGTVEARDRDHAARLFYADAGDRVVNHVAISEAAWKPVTRRPKVVQSAEYVEFAPPKEVEVDAAPPELAEPLPV